MVKYLKIIPCFSLLFSCIFIPPIIQCPEFPLPLRCYRCYRIPENKDYERLVKLKIFKLKEPMQRKDFKVIDTTAIYKESYYVDMHGKKYNRSLPYPYSDTDICIALRFYKDGHFTEFNCNVEGGKDFIFRRNKFSVFTYGRFVLDGNKIKTEQFYPIRGGRTNYFCRTYRGGNNQ